MQFVFIQLDAKARRLRQGHLTVGKGERHADNIVFQQQRAEHLGTPLQRQRRPACREATVPTVPSSMVPPYRPIPAACATRASASTLFGPGFGDFQRVSAGKARCAS